VQVRLFVYRSSSSIPFYIVHSRSFFLPLNICFLTVYCLFAYLLILLLQRNGPTPPSLLWLSQTNRDSCHRPLCLLCWTQLRSFRRMCRFSPQQRFHLTSSTGYQFEVSKYNPHSLDIRHCIIIYHLNTGAHTSTLFCTPFAFPNVVRQPLLAESWFVNHSF